jgi:hypothetical protein
MLGSKPEVSEQIRNKPHDNNKKCRRYSVCWQIGLFEEVIEEHYRYQPSKKALLKIWEVL